MKIVLYMVLAATLVAAPALAQQPSDGTVASGIAPLVRELRALGWPDGEIEALQAAISVAEADAFDDAPADVVALALSFVRERSSDTSAEERAGLALELARVSSAMADVGFSRLEIGRAALEGTRDAIADRDHTNGAGEPGRAFPGAGLRERMVSRIRNQVRAIAAGRGPEVVRTILDRLDRPAANPAPVNGPPDLPGGGPGGPDL